MKILNHASFLAALRKLSVERARQGFRTYDNVPDLFWTTALAGEVGELCNLIKKIERFEKHGLDAGTNVKVGELTPEEIRNLIKEEIGGILIYLDLFASKYNINLEEATTFAFNDKSEKYNLGYLIVPWKNGLGYNTLRFDTNDPEDLPQVVPFNPPNKLPWNQDALSKLKEDMLKARLDDGRDMTDQDVTDAANEIEEQLNNGGKVKLTPEEVTKDLRAAFNQEGNPTVERYLEKGAPIKPAKETLDAAGAGLVQHNLELWRKEEEKLHGTLKVTLGDLGDGKEFIVSGYYRTRLKTYGNLLFLVLEQLNLKDVWLAFEYDLFVNGRQVSYESSLEWSTSYRYALVRKPGVNRG